MLIGWQYIIALSENCLVGSYGLNTYLSYDTIIPLPRIYIWRMKMSIHANFSMQMFIEIVSKMDFWCWCLVIGLGTSGPVAYISSIVGWFYSISVSPQDRWLGQRSICFQVSEDSSLVVALVYTPTSCVLRHLLSTFLPTLSVSGFWVIAILTGERWDLILVFLCIFPMAYEPKHLFHMSFGHFHSILWKLPTRVLYLLLNWTACFIVEFLELLTDLAYSFFINHIFCKCFSPFCWLPLHFLVFLAFFWFSFCCLASAVFSKKPLLVPIS